jgi:hypothetical protein
MEPAGLFAIQGHQESQLPEFQKIQHLQAPGHFMGIFRHQGFSGFVPDSSQVLEALFQQRFIPDLSCIIRGIRDKNLLFAKESIKNPFS